MVLMICKGRLCRSLAGVKEGAGDNSKVLSIDLYSSKEQSAGCIAAMTTGPSGLVRKAKAATRTAD